MDRKLFTFIVPEVFIIIISFCIPNIDLLIGYNCFCGGCCEGCYNDCSFHLGFPFPYIYAGTNWISGLYHSYFEWEFLVYDIIISIIWTILNVFAFNFLKKRLFLRGVSPNIYSITL